MGGQIGGYEINGILHNYTPSKMKEKDSHIDPFKIRTFNVYNHSGESFYKSQLDFIKDFKTDETRKKVFRDHLFSGKVESVFYRHNLPRKGFDKIISTSIYNDGYITCAYSRNLNMNRFDLSTFIKGKRTGYQLTIQNEFIKSFQLESGIKLETISARGPNDFAYRYKVNLDELNFYLSSKDSLNRIEKTLGDIWSKDSDHWTDLEALAGEQTVAKEIVRAYEKMGISKSFEEALMEYRVFRRIRFMNETSFDQSDDFLTFYIEQKKMREKILPNNYVEQTVKYIAGVAVAVDKAQQRMVAVIIILDAKTNEILERATHEIAITFTFVPGLFSFREITPLLKAFKNLKLKPDLIFCNGHGIDHPQNIGLASYLGLHLEIPTVACSETRLAGFYDKNELGLERGNYKELTWDNHTVGAALRTQKNANPVFVSIGHMIDLDTSLDWVLKLCPYKRLPLPCQLTDELIEDSINKLTLDFFNDIDN